MNKRFEHFLEKIILDFEGEAEVLSEASHHVVIFLKDSKKLGEFVEKIKLFHKFRMLIDICGVDYPTNFKRFEVVYQFLNIEHNLRLTLKLQVAENESVPSISEIFSSACWFERETFDMYGVEFSGAKDLRRILTDYDFEGFPLRKDVPLTGFVELRYDPTLERIVKEPVNLSQEYRNFDFESPWENVQYSVKKS